MRAAELLGPGGPFIEAWPGYEPRPGQLEMAEAVERCLERGGIAMLEAGTGTGKTLAYLIPALLAAHRQRIVISTSTRALQDQIYGRDLPRVLAVLGIDVEVALMKGLSNYVCRRRAREFLTGGDSLSSRWSGRLPLLERWLGETATGAIDELEALPEDDPLWARVTASSERRIGSACAHYEACHVTAMKRRASAADVIVVNHHLFFADLALRGDHPGRVIPDYDAVIFDEAHQLEEVATRYFGVSVSSGRVDRLCRDAERLLPLALGDRAAHCAHRVGASAERLFDCLERSLPRAEARRALSPDAWAGELSETWFELDTALEGLSGRVALADAQADSPPDRDGSDLSLALDALSRRADALREDLGRLARGEPGQVGWFEAGEHSRCLGASPVDVGPILRERCFDRVSAVVLTSATLACGATAPDAVRRRDAERPSRAAARAEPDDESPTDADADADADPDAMPSARGPFRYFRQRLGLDEAMYAVDERVVASPFAFREQALLYLPDDLPVPQAPGFAAAASRRSAELIELSGGGAFVLCTSHRGMASAHAALKKRFPDRLVLVQGQLPRAALTERFRNAGDAVLVATLGFWQGVDVPGSALRLVILEKAPFPVPSDPLLEARGRALAEAGQPAFTRLHLPLAQLTLKQGFGRLIRQRTDRGVVALLDARVHHRGYGKRLLEGLPDARRVTDLASVKAFWQEQRGEISSDSVRARL